MILRKLFAVVGLFCSSQIVYADSINIQISDASARFIYAAEVFGGQFGPTDFEMGAYFNDDDDTVVHTSLVVRSDSIDNPVFIAIGGRLYYADIGNAVDQTPAEVAAIAFGLELSFRPEGLYGAGITASYFVSPSVTTFMDGDRFSEYSLALDFNVTQQVGVYLAYRNMSTELDNGTEIEIDDSFILGFSFRF